MTPKISVVIPVYNTAEYLGQCLDTILLQTLQEIEVICIDDGSTDDSLSCLQGYAFLDNRLKVVHQENAGSGVACNRGLKEATGEYVIFLDSDDFFEADMLEKMLARAELDKSDMVVCGHYIFDEKLKKTETNLIPKQFLKQSIWTPEELLEDLFNFCDPSSWNKLIRRELIVKNDLHFDENIPTNALMFHCLSLVCSEKISMMENAFVYKRVNIPGKESKDKKDEVIQILKTLTNTYEKLKKLNLWDTYQISLLNRIRRSLQLELIDCEAKHKKKVLLSIQKTLPTELYEQLFSTTYPAISIIIPAYNTAIYLPECLESVLNQTLQNIEIICVDDGSTDNTLEVLNGYAKKDKRIQVIHQENSGQAVARNTATEKATGQFIQFLDSDDYLEPEACECIYTYMSLFGLEMCQVAAIEFNDQTRKEFEEPYHTLQWLPEKMIPVFSYQNLLSCLSNVAVTAWMTIYRRAFLIKNQIEWIHEKLFYEDTPFFVEAILKAERVGALPDKFYHRRIHPLAVTQNMASNFKDYTKVIKHTLKMILRVNQEENVFLSYTRTLLVKAWGNFARLMPEVQMTQAPHMYNLCLHIVKKYRYSLPVDIQEWCLRYAKSKGKKKLLKLRFYLFLAKLNRPDYTINLIQVVRKPEWCIKVFGLPIFQVIRSPMILDEEELLLQKKVNKAEEIFYKICGLTFLKVEKKDLYG